MMGLVIAYRPFTMTGEVKLVVQAAKTRFVVACNVNPVALVGHVKTTFAPEALMDRVGAGTLTTTDANKTLKIVPLP